MQPNPKKVKPNNNQDYASIYEENFVKTNNPAQLGQQAFARQLSNGVRNKLNPGQTGQGTFISSGEPTFVDPGSSVRAGSGGSAGGTINPNRGTTIQDPVTYNQSPSANGSGTLGVGAGGGAAIDRFQGYGVAEDQTAGMLNAATGPITMTPGNNGYGLFDGRVDVEKMDPYAGRVLPQLGEDGTLMRQSELGYTAASGGKSPVPTLDDILATEEERGYGMDGNNVYDPNKTSEGGGDSGDGGGDGVTGVENFNQNVTTEVDRLNALLDEEEAFINQQYAQQYNQMVAMAENRAAREGTMPFTGGIARQIEDYMSAGEIQQMSQLARMRDQALTEIRLNRDNVRNQALTNVMNNLQLETAALDQKFQYKQGFASYVINGDMTLAEAQAYADQFGLGNITETITNAVSQQILAGAMSKEMAATELEALGIDTAFLDDIKGAGELQFSDFSTSEEAGELEGAISDVLTEAGGASFGQIITGVLAGAGTGALAGAILPVGGPIVGAIVGAIAGGINAANVDLNANDLTQITSTLFQRQVILEQGESIISGELDSMTFVRPAGQDNTYGQLSNQFQVTVNGETYTMDGADIMVLAAALKQKGYSTTDARYKALFETAAQVKQSSNVVNFSRVLDAALGQRYSTIIKFYNQVF